MTIEQKAKAYDEALERAKDVLETDLHESSVWAIKKIFPELFESEDERIRTELYAVINDLVLPDEQKARFNAWLEKQGNLTKALQISNARIGELIEENYYLKEQLEKQKEQKPANEPKFKVGDWIIFAENHNSVYQVERIDKYRYYLRHYLGGTLSAHFDNELVRQWTIQDAKPGDVLVCIGKYGQEIGIVKEYVGKYGGCDKCFETYCFVDWEGIFRTGEYMGSKEIHPATKEQRNTLMKAMADNRYTFDFENKKLNKIEQKPAEWSEEDEAMKNDIIDGLKNLWPYDHRDRCIAWLKSLRPKSKVILKEKDAWCCSVAWACVRDSEGYTEEEKEYIRKFLYRCNPISQPHWKPNEEQKPETKLTRWVARDRDGGIWVYDLCPKKDSERGLWRGDGGSMLLDEKSFPDLKWEDEPMEVEITIRKK